MTETLVGEKKPGELSRLELQIIQRICLELYCQYEQSLNFRELEPPTNTTYYEIVCSPISLDVIRTRLDPSSPNHYKEISTFLADVRLIFKNAFLYYQEDSKHYANAKYLENFFEEQLAKWLPNYSIKLAHNSLQNSAHNSAASSPRLEAMENGRKSCNAALEGLDIGCPPSKRLRKLTE